MSRICGGVVVLVVALVVSGIQKTARAEEYSAEVIQGPAPSEGVSKEIQDKLATTGVRLKRGSDTFAEIWSAKDWAVKADFHETNDIKFPFTPGEFIGLIRYSKKATDFRNQDIKPGIYTLRAALQPVDGNHVGTSDTRDFFLLLKTADDTSPAALEEKNMFKLSPKAAGGTHPCMLFIRRPGEAAELPAVKHDEEGDRWSLVFAGTPQGGSSPLAVEVNLVGIAKE
jgi:hypothetical protein